MKQELSEVEKEWLEWLVSRGLLFLVRNKLNNSLNAYSDKPNHEDDYTFWYDSNISTKSINNLIDNKLFDFIDTNTVYKICRNVSGELELVALQKGESLWT